MEVRSGWRKPRVAVCLYCSKNNLKTGRMFGLAPRRHRRDAAGSENPRNLGENRIRVGQMAKAHIAHDRIEALVIEWQTRCVTFNKRGVRNATAGTRQHCWRKIQPGYLRPCCNESFGSIPMTATQIQHDAGVSRARCLHE